MTALSTPASFADYDPVTDKYVKTLNNNYLIARFSAEYGTCANDKCPYKYYLSRCIKSISHMNCSDDEIFRNIYDILKLFTDHNITVHTIALHTQIWDLLRDLCRSWSAIDSYHILYRMFAHPKYNEIAEMIRKLLGLYSFRSVPYYTIHRYYSDIFRNAEYVFDIEIKTVHKQRNNGNTATREEFVLSAPIVQSIREKLFTEMQYYIKYMTIHLKFPHKSRIFKTLDIGDILNMYHLFESNNSMFNALHTYVLAHKRDVIVKFEKYIESYIIEMIENNIPNDVSDHILYEYMMGRMDISKTVYEPNDVKTKSIGPAPDDDNNDNDNDDNDDDNDDDGDVPPDGYAK